LKFTKHQPIEKGRSKKDMTEKRERKSEMCSIWFTSFFSAPSAISIAQGINSRLNEDKKKEDSFVDGQIDLKLRRKDKFDGRFKKSCCEFINV
jgi:hypothetical protein